MRAASLMDVLTFAFHQRKVYTIERIEVFHPMPTEQATEAAISVTPVPARSGMSVRLRGLVVAAPIMAVMAVAAYLHPDERGMGTHEQLHMGACNFVCTTGWPCPTCGMTTSFSALAHGQVGLAFRAHAFGPVLVAAMMAIWALAMAELTTGRSFLGRLRWRWWWLICGLVGLACGWGLKAYLGWADGTFPIR
jgi:hypothetical protein